MKLNTVNNLPYIVIDNFYTQEELEDINKELDFLAPKLLPPENTGSATDIATGELLKKNKGIFLDDLYGNHRFVSYILTHNRKLFNKDLMENLEKTHPLFRFISSSNQDVTLLSYYENSDYYEEHFDSASVTILNWFYKEPKSFDGGNLILEGTDTVEVKHNRVVIFPSIMKHEVTKITMEEQNLKQGLGRFCASTFIYVTSS